MVEKTQLLVVQVVQAVAVHIVELQGVLELLDKVIMADLVQQLHFQVQVAVEVAEHQQLVETVLVPLAVLVEQVQPLQLQVHLSHTLVVAAGLELQMVQVVQVVEQLVIGTIQEFLEL
jgi:uncharacterized Fe-S cluster-containing radical SAM superfamily protein